MCTVTKDVECDNFTIEGNQKVYLNQTEITFDCQIYQSKPWIIGNFLDCRLRVFVLIT